MQVSFQNLMVWWRGESLNKLVKELEIRKVDFKEWCTVSERTLHQMVDDGYYPGF